MNNEPRMGMILTVLRRADGADCTNGGVSSKTATILVTGPEIPKIFSETADCPAFTIGDRGGYKFLTPVVPCPRDRAGYMMGGNYAVTCDSRWNFGALPIHDRTESAEECRRYSD